MTTIELVDSVTELNDLSSFMKDDKLDEALELVVKFIVAENPPPPAKMNALILKLQAISSACGIKATYYQNFTDTSNPDNKKRKNVYYTMNDKLDRLVDALKIVLRYST